MNAEQEPEQLEAPSRTRDASAPSRGRSARERVRAVRAGERRRHGHEGYDDAAAAPGAAPSANAVSAGRSAPAHHVEPADRAASPESMSDPAAQTAERDGLELVEKLGEGGGSRTWLARERTTHEKYTVTFVVTEDREHRRGSEEQIAALVETWAETPHPELVSVRATLGGDGASRALVADHVRGKTLEDTMRDRGRLRPEDTAPVLAAVARALSHLHERGWVHGDLAAPHVLLTLDGRTLVDGYGVPAGSSVGPVPWGVADRPAHPGVALGHAEDAYTAAQDVHALGVLGWLALTGRHPGPESHRVPLTLMCPAAPRHLVLMLEAALADDPAARPSARELAAGFAAAAPRSKPAGRPSERMTPEVIRADGTVVRPRRLVPRRLVARSPGRSESGRSVSGGTAVAEVHPFARRTAWLAAAGVLGAAVLAWGFLAWDGGEPVAGPAEPGATSAAEAGTASSAPGAGAPESSGNGTPSDGTTSAPEGSDGSEAAPSARAAAAPGETMQDKDGEARRAVETLVSARGAALAAGDETAVGEVYVPDSGLAARDRDLIRRAKAQDTSGSGFTALSGVSMDVVRLTEQRPRTGSGLTPAEAARTRTYDAEVRTRGWHGELPTGSHVTRKGDDARQILRISVTHTPQGWRLADVTPVAAAP